ncbi:MAG: prolyl oligopeptidase family serine peptidase [Hyphomonadaceae bacterium]
MFIRAVAAFAALALFSSAHAQPAREAPRHFQPADVFNLEYAADPQISPDGRRVAYVRVSGDIRSDRFRRSIWLVDDTGQNNRPIAQGAGAYASPVWSPDGRAIAYLANEQSGAELRVLYLDTMQSGVLARLPSGAANLTWSPDGRTLAFQMFVREEGPSPARMPDRPEGAEWAAPARIIDGVLYRADGEGYVQAGYTQIFTLPADGGTPRQLTFAARHHDGRLSWSPDGRALYFSANAEENWEYDPVESDIYRLDIASGSLTRLTTRNGPEDAPIVSPDGRRIAYIGFDDREQGYQVTELYVANADGSGARSLTASFDRDVRRPNWIRGGGAIMFLYEDHGRTHLGIVNVASGQITRLPGDVGGLDLGRPYTSGSYSVTRNGRYAITYQTPTRPADVAIGQSGAPRRLTRLNDDLLDAREIPAPQEINARSSADGRNIQAWIVRPPGFDASRRYPLLLEIHGGPFAAYGPSFSAEVQMYAAAGYVVVYANPRGSTSYGGEFGNLIHHNYPSQDYDDLMSVVDAVIAQEPIDPQRLFVTGGSGGGVLTAWIVGSTNRFAAAVVQKPVINWTSFSLTSDFYPLFTRYWFGAMPWEDQANYWRRSPLSLVGNVTTPTAVLTGEDDLRTPMAESEQYYQALRLRRVPTRLIRIPGASHDIAARPSGLIA